MLEGYKPVTTQIFDKDSKYLDNDSVFAVKDSLVVEFRPREGDEQAKCQLEYDVRMVPLEAEGESGPRNGLVTGGGGVGAS